MARVPIPVALAGQLEGQPAVGHRARVARVLTVVAALAALATVAGHPVRAAATTTGRGVLGAPTAVLDRRDRVVPVAQRVAPPPIVELLAALMMGGLRVRVRGVRVPAGRPAAVAMARAETANARLLPVAPGRRGQVPTAVIVRVGHGPPEAARGVILGRIRVSTVPIVGVRHATGQIAGVRKAPRVATSSEAVRAVVVRAVVVPVAVVRMAGQNETQRGARPASR